MSEQVEVAHVITRLNVGGPARHIAHLMHALPALGVAPTLITGVEDPNEGRLDPGVPHAVLRSLGKPIAPWADVRAMRSLARAFLRRRPAIVHTHLAKAGALGRLAARQAEVRAVVHTFHGHVLDGYFGALRERAFLQAERALARRTDALVAVSVAVRDELLDLGIGAASRWHVIPLAVELGPLFEEAPEPGVARRAMGLPEAVPVVGIVGRLVPIKDHTTFLAAAAELGAADPSVHFAIVGEGEDRAAIERAVPVAIRDRVRFTGWVTDLPPVYAAMDVVALSSRNEGTPVALLEAGAAGRPVVATRVGGVADVVRDGTTGLLVPPGDASALASALRRVLEDPALARSLGEEARRIAARRAEAERPAARLAELYRALV